MAQLVRRNRKMLPSKRGWRLKVRTKSLSANERGVVESMLVALMGGKIGKWYLGNKSKKFSNKRALVNSEKLAKSGVSRDHMDGTARYYGR